MKILEKWLLISFDQVTTMLQATSPSQRKFLESTRAEVSKIAKRTRFGPI
jgi:hypothetical protein